ncbi:LacI family DNA-binding transcriptional regulator [Rhodoferax sp.]|uniref:LacI family DNA-binding transcriptional regulator n=1 Tax=Rhodoferax sp. TaxID=50421 RepID=UPI00283FEDF8|nr:LacI family DNA-binding transcriptional regulator [Rhodoferax sp.]MDR3371891.1 LacI family DNA-binding transcriptional regulator [Rhodoferax sp.]
MVKIVDVAKQAGVSTASVSRVMSGSPGVSDETRERVNAAVKLLGYRPDLAARRLRSGRTDTLGLIVSDIRNPFFTEVSRAVEDVAYQNGMRVLLCNSDEDPEKEAFYLEMMRDENVSGVILSPTLSLLKDLRPMNYPFPLVLVDRCERDVDVDAVVLDNFDAGYRLTEHLIAQGCRRIVFLYGAVGSTGPQRHQGYLAAMSAASLAPEAEPITPRSERAREMAERLLQRDPLSDALVASSGLVLQGIAEAIKAAGVQVPSQIAVAGFDDLPWTRLVTPDITVIRQPTNEIGQTALRLLLERVASPDRAVRSVVLRGELVVRGSTQRLIPLR